MACNSQSSGRFYSQQSVGTCLQSESWDVSDPAAGQTGEHQNISALSAHITHEAYSNELLVIHVKEAREVFWELVVAVSGKRNRNPVDYERPHKEMFGHKHLLRGWGAGPWKAGWQASGREDSRGLEWSREESTSPQTSGGWWVRLLLDWKLTSTTIGINLKMGRQKWWRPLQQRWCARSLILGTAFPHGLIKRAWRTVLASLSNRLIHGSKLPDIRPIDLNGYQETRTRSEMVIAEKTNHSIRRIGQTQT